MGNLQYDQISIDKHDMHDKFDMYDTHDMQQYNISSEDWLDKLYAENPLIGNRLLPEKTKEKLFNVTKGYIDKRLREPLIRFPLKAKMQIALAVITYAKEWDVGDESGFWRYITAQFGYRDDNGQLREILCDCVLEATQKNRRWFISSAIGNQYKSTIVVHALAPKRSWKLLYDFLFDFYKTNMEWTYIEDDPIIARMVDALRGKLKAGDEADDDNLEISTKVYSFQEGIRKLIIYRTEYAVKLISHMLGRIDGIINHTETPARLYVDVLCDQWIEGKLNNARDAKSRGTTSSARDVAIDYTRIRPLYVLQNETNVVISVPDIRLKKTDFVKVELKVYAGETNVETKSLSFYGNELGKTLNGFNLDLDMCMRRGDGSLRIRIVLSCDEEVIFDSGDNLYREYLCFTRGKECDIRECEKGSYSIFTTADQTLEFTDAEVSEIDSKSWWNAYFVRLGQGFIIKFNDQILSFDDSETSVTGGVRVVYPSSYTGAEFIKNGRRYDVISKEANLLLISHEQLDLRKYAVMMNSRRLELDSINWEITGNGVIYTIPLKVDTDKTCEFQIVDFEQNRILSRGEIKLIPGFSVAFNRKFYLADSDFENAYVTITILRETKRYELNSSDEFISFNVDEGNVELKIPRVIIRDDSGEKWKYGYSEWIRDIKQDEKIYLSYPDSCSVLLKVGNVDVVEESKGCFGLGNAVFAYSEVDHTGWIEMKLHVAGKNLAQDYVIGRLSNTERFLTAVRFDYHDNTLYWNRGTGFLGNKNSRFKLCIDAHEGTKEYPIDLDDEIAINKPDLTLDEYSYRIVKGSENIFLGEETILHRGTLFIGDKNELRFHNSMIEITNITYEEDGNQQSVEIKNTYIDQIEYQGIQFVDSEDRECPVYCGVMFYMGQSLKHHDFSFEEKESEKGFLLYKVNPVKIVYINEHTLSITNEDNDGIYYHRNFNKNLMENTYAITDREPTSRNQNMYYLADLYTYRKERIQ